MYLSRLDEKYPILIVFEIIDLRLFDSNILLCKKVVTQLTTVNFINKYFDSCRKSDLRLFAFRMNVIGIFNNNKIIRHTTF